MGHGLRDFLPSGPPLLPIPRIFTKGSVIKVVTVPTTCWTCTSCGKHLKAGEKAAKIGKVIICSECIQKGA